MKVPHSKLMFLLVAMACAGLMVFSFFLQFVLKLEPCPLCISQRIAMTCLGLLALMAALHNPQSTSYRVYSAVLMLFSLIGSLLAGRQLWIQHLPPEKVPSCMPNIEYLIDILPMTEIMQIMVTGTGDCATVQWSFLGLTIPGWTLIMFFGFLLVGLFELFRKRIL